jgi:hypothetical protein
MIHLLRKIFSFLVGVVICYEDECGAGDLGWGCDCAICNSELLWGVNYCSNCGRKIVWKNRGE